MKRLALLFTLLLAADAYSGCNDGLKGTLHGEVVSIKTDAPYPFTTRCGVVWECKVKIETYGSMYKAYPTSASQCFRRGEPIPCCELVPGEHVDLLYINKPNSTLRGEILLLKVVEHEEPFHGQSSSR